jgi:hypothetical protein
LKNTVIVDTNGNKCKKNEQRNSIMINNTMILMQKCAVNDATFRIPDMSGWQPSHECVCSDDPRMQVLDTSVPVDKVIGMEC